MSEYEITVVRRDPNPAYVPDLRSPFDGYQREDRREPDQREPYLSTRTLTVTLTDGEYEAVRRALMEHWAK